jgi:hypothetical protein
LKHSFLATDQNFAAPWSQQQKKGCRGPVGLTKNPPKAPVADSRRRRTRKVTPHRIWLDFGGVPFFEFFNKISRFRKNVTMYSRGDAAGGRQAPGLTASSRFVGEIRKSATKTLPFAEREFGDDHLLLCFCD